MSEITLANIGGGAAIEKFQEELGRVVENILDPNTEALAKRQIVLTVTFKPSNDRKFGDVAVATLAKLAPSTAFTTRAFFGKPKAGNPSAFEDDPRQITIDDYVSQPSNVAAMSAKKAEEGK